MQVKNRRKRRGMSLIEAMLVFPILLAVTFGLIEYGNLLLRLQQVANVSRQAARTAALADATSSDVSNTIDTMMATAGINKKNYSVSYANPASVNKGDPISVTITVTYSNIAITGNGSNKDPLIPVPGTISRTVVMAKEGP